MIAYALSICVSLVSANPATSPKNGALRPTSPIAGNETVSFQREVMAVLTKGGCNSGACHGAPSGKGGLRLSLLGFDPAADFNALTREEQGRRVNRIEADQSLLLAKAAGSMPHEGGRVFALDSAEFALLRGWIDQGARYEPPGIATRVARLEVLSDTQTVEPPVDELHLRVLAHFADGVVRDVTSLTLFRSNDEMVATIASGGQVRFHRPGEIAALARYIGSMQTRLLNSLPPKQTIAWSTPPENNSIDRLAFANLKRLRIHPSGLCTDAEFLRRVSLDLTGRLPSVDRAQAFLTDKRLDKRARLIDELLESAAYVDFWAMKWSDLLGCNQRFVGRRGAYIYHRWIRTQIADNVPLDQFVHQLVSAEGGNYRNPPAGFYRRLRKAEDQAESVGQLFLGVRVQCARCHNHPFERWLQDDYYGLTAFFARIRRKDGILVRHVYNKEEIIYQDRKSETVHPRTGEIVPPTPLGSEPMPEASDDRLESLANWLTTPENPFFARTLVNRYWYHMFGRGIVEPVDDFRASNPPSHPAVLASLTTDFVEYGFDARHLLRTIANSSLYQLSATPNETNADDDKYFSRARVRLLSAEQLLDAVVQVTEVPEKFGPLPLGATAVQLPDGEYQHPFLKVFGKPLKSIACECERESDSNLEQALHLIAGSFLADRLRSDRSRIARLLKANASDTDVINELYLASLSRYPSKDETSLILHQLADGSDRRRVLDDMLWSILNVEEFLFQH